MPPIRSLGSLRVRTLHNRYVQIWVLSLRGRRGIHWLSITWWEGGNLHLVILKLNGRITGEEYIIISIQELARTLLERQNRRLR